MMNTGAFVSSASTKVPVMLETITNNLHADKGEVAILISDMKYSPVGAAAPNVLLSQYSTDVSKILGTYGKAVCLVGATSNYLDKQGAETTQRSPYYYFIIGNAQQVAFMRDAISTKLQNNHHFVDNIESGFNYGTPKYAFGIPTKCFQINDEPTFVNYEEADGDTCTIKLKVDLTPYRWIMTDTAYFRKALTAKTLYGSQVKVGNINIKCQTITDKMLIRTATANVDLKLYNMATDSEIIEWNLTLPELDITYFNEFFDGAVDENDVTKSFSVADFIKGIFYGGVVNKNLKPNYILVSKNS